MPGTSESSINRLQIEQRNCGGRIVEIDCAVLQAGDYGWRQRIEVHLQTDSQRSFRADARSHAARLNTCDRLMKFKSVSPERFISKGVESEGASARKHHVLGIVRNHVWKLNVRGFAHGKAQNSRMKWLTLERVVPMISASVSWLIFGITISGLPSLPKLASRSRTRASRFTRVKELAGAGSVG
jgi:hypothetical protein